MIYNYIEVSKKHKNMITNKIVKICNYSKTINL